MPIWFPKGPAPQLVGTQPSLKNVSGRVSALAFSPSYNGAGVPALFCGAAGGGVWRCANLSTPPPIWSPLTDMMGLPLVNSLVGLGAGMIDIGSIAVDINDPKLVFVGTGEANNSADCRYGSGILRSPSGGDTWAISYGPSTRSGLPILYAFFRHSITKIIIHPISNNVAYAAVSVSADPNTGTPSEKGNHLVLDNAIYMTADGGISWSIISIAIADPVTVTDLEFLYSATTGQVIIFAGVKTGNHGKGGIWQTTNSGLSWDPLTNGLPGPTQYQRIALAADHGSGGVKIYAAVALNDNTIAVFKSENLGASWTDVTPGQIGKNLLYNLAFARSPNGRLYLGGLDKIYQSIPGGPLGPGDWTEIASMSSNPPHVDHHAFAFSADGQTMYDGNDGGVWRFPVPNGPWEDFNTGPTDTPGLSIIQCNAVAVKPTPIPDIMIEGSQDNGFAESSNALTLLPRWTERLPGDGQFVRYAQGGQFALGYRFVGFGELYRSNTNGVSWINVPLPGAQADWGFFAPFSISRQHVNRFAIASKTTIRETFSAGVDWAAIWALPDTSGVTALIYDPADDDIIYVGFASGAIYRGNRVLEGDWQWTLLSDGSNPAHWGTGVRIGGIDANPNVPGIVYMCIRHFTADPMDVGKRAWRSTNHGVGWNDITDTLPNLPVNSIMWAQENMVEVLYVGTDSGVYRRANPGGTGTPWEFYGENLPNVQVLDIQKAVGGGYTVLAAATHGRGVWAIQSPPP